MRLLKRELGSPIDNRRYTAAVRFFQAGPVADSLYAGIRDDEELSEHRDWLERLWGEYEGINPDPNFVSAARSQLNQAFWQMYVAHVLRENGLDLARPPDGGPDVLIKNEEGKTWVEAVCPRPGTGRDAVKRRPRGGGLYSLDRRAICLRYTAALAAKSKQHEEWLRRRVVAASDTYIVAIGGAELVDSDLEKGTPDIVRAVLGLGEHVWKVPVEQGWHAVERGIAEQRELQNKNLSSVATDGFLTGCWANVSAVLFAPTRIWDRPSPAGKDVIFVPNASASVTVREDYLGFGRAYGISSGELHCIDLRVRAAKAQPSA
ncbi:MAG: hypothetical protein HYZ29_07170 [Myxococcales bacterium]|nr:hypothetical protein [Myxococcales bacterium]